MSKEPLEQLNELNNLASGITKRTTEYMLESVNGLFNDTAKNLSELSNVKKMEDALAIQTRIASDMGNKLMKRTQEALNLWQENSTDMGKFMEHCSRSMSTINPMNMVNPSKTAQGSEKKG